LASHADRGVADRGTQRPTAADVPALCIAPDHVAIAVGGNGLFPPRGVGLTAPPGPSQYMVFALPKR
jgi:hypothetical protein